VLRYAAAPRPPAARPQPSAVSFLPCASGDIFNLAPTNIAREKEIMEMFDTSVKEKINAEVQQKVTKSLAAQKRDEPRQKELETHFTHALESLFARIERGMTVEIRFLPPKDAATATSPGADLIAAEIESDINTAAWRRTGAKAPPN
jgi:hypothetical protein